MPKARKKATITISKPTVSKSTVSKRVKETITIGDEFVSDITLPIPSGQAAKTIALALATLGLKEQDVQILGADAKTVKLKLKSNGRVVTYVR